jgi:hypothetical protein
MQKARIITLRAETGRRLAGQLRERGYSVEIVPPGCIFPSPADLEIELDTFGEDRALQLVAELPFSSPTGQPSNPRTFTPDDTNPNLDEAPLAEPSVIDTLTGVAAAIQNKRDLLAKALREQRARARQARTTEYRQRESSSRVAQHRVQELPAQELGEAVPDEKQNPVPHGAGEHPDSKPLRARRRWRAVSIAAALALVFLLGWSVGRRTSLRQPSTSSGLNEQVLSRDTTNAPITASLPAEIPEVPNRAPKDANQTDAARASDDSKSQRTDFATPAGDPEDLIAQDKVRYFRTGTKRAIASPPHENAQLKRISDLE